MDKIKLSEKDTHRVSKVKIRIDNNDFTNSELNMIMPTEIIEKIMIDATTWEKTWRATTETHLAYQKSAKEFQKSKWKINE